MLQPRKALKECSALGEKDGIFTELERREVSGSSASFGSRCWKRLLLRGGVGLLDYPLLAEQFRFYQEEAGGRDEALRPPEGRMEISQSFVCLLSCLSRVWLFCNPVDLAHQALLSTGFSRQEYCSGLRCCLMVLCWQVEDAQKCRRCHSDFLTS